MDLHHLPGRAEADRYLPHPRILVADIGVDFGEQLDLAFEARRIERIVVAIEPHIGVRRGCRESPAIAAAHGCDRVGGADQRRQRDVGGMGVADGVILHGAQAEALRGVVGRLFQPAIVEHQRFGLAVFQKQFAVVGAGQAPRQFVANGIAVEVGAVEQGGCGGIGHEDSSQGSCSCRPANAGTHNHRFRCLAIVATRTITAGPVFKPRLPSQGFLATLVTCQAMVNTVTCATGRRPGRR